MLEEGVSAHGGGPAGAEALCLGALHEAADEVSSVLRQVRGEHQLAFQDLLYGLGPVVARERWL